METKKRILIFVNKLFEMRKEGLSFKHPFVGITTFNSLRHLCLMSDITISSFQKMSCHEIIDRLWFYAIFEHPNSEGTLFLDSLFYNPVKKMSEKEMYSYFQRVFPEKDMRDYPVYNDF